MNFENQAPWCESDEYPVPENSFFFSSVLNILKLTLPFELFQSSLYPSNEFSSHKSGPRTTKSNNNRNIFILLSLRAFEWINCAQIHIHFYWIRHRHLDARAFLGYNKPVPSLPLFQNEFSRETIYMKMFSTRKFIFTVKGLALKQRRVASHNGPY